MKLASSITVRTLVLSLIAFLKLVLTQPTPKGTLALDDMVIMLNNKDTDRLDAKAPP